MATIETYVSLNSPWAYMGWGRLMAIAQRQGASILVKPAKFGAVFAKTGGLPLAQRSPERQAYRLMELRRWRDHLGLPFAIQPRFTQADETFGARLVIAAGMQGLDTARLAFEIGRAQWELEHNIADISVIDASAERAGINPVSVRLNAPGAAELDRIWEGHTPEALSRGVFGAPSYILADGEIFWGQDRLEFLERALVRYA
jgi:2-hydroxychromene-2-carboxylate isomerase